MGIFCEINLFKPSDGVYRPGQVVSGLIKYAVDVPMEFEKITTSLKGNGYVRLIIRRNKERRTFRSSEVYIDVDNIVQNEKNTVPVGVYEIKFGFPTPYNLPSSIDLYSRVLNGNVICKILYYIRIKFEMPGIFAINKRFKKEITMIAGVTPTLLREPVLYGETKKLMRLFSGKNSVINIKATILNSIIPSGGKIEMHYEVENNSNVLVKSVKTKLIEVYKFKTVGYRDVEAGKNIPDTDTKTTSINCGDTQTMPLEINIPSDIHSLEYSKIISRRYIVVIEVALPIPHRNLILKIPLQIGEINENIQEHSLEYRVEDVAYDDPPPSYWETMGVSKKNDDEESDGDENVKCEKNTLFEI